MWHDDTLALRWMGHSTVLLKHRGETIITDPFLRTRLYHLRRMGKLPEPGFEGDGRRLLILISHVHHDHLDFPSLRRLNAHATVVVPPGAGQYLATRIPQTIVEIGVGQELRTEHMRVIPVEALHGGRRWPGFRADVQGYVIHAGATVYFAGDTKLFPQMGDLGQRHDIDLALLPVWGHSPRLGKNHMNPMDAAKALALIGARSAVPIHWGTIRPIGIRDHSFMWRPPQEFVLHASVCAPRATVRILKPSDEVVIRAGSGLCRFDQRAAM